MALPTISTGTYVSQYDFSTLGLSDGTAIASVSDPIGGNTASQATGANQPICKTAIQNGLSIARFDGVNPMSLDASGLTVSQPDTIFMVAAVTNLVGGCTLIDGITTRQIIRSGDPTGWELYAGTLLNSGTKDSSFHYFTAVLNGASSSLRIDGTGTISGDAGALALSGLRIGLNNDGSSVRLGGDVGEIVVASGALNATDRDAVEAYLIAKWFTAPTPQFIHPFNAIPFMTGH